MRREIIEIQKKNDSLKSENKELKNENSKMKEQLSSIKEELKVLEKERSEFEIENREIKEINEILMEDIADLNEKIGHLIPGNIEKEIDELRENNAILKTVLQMYKENEKCDDNFENNFGAEQTANCDENVETRPEALILFDCQECNFSSHSQRGLNVHIGLKHRSNIHKN